MRGYLPADSETGQAILEEDADAKALAELEHRKAELLMELHSIEENLKHPQGDAQQGIIPGNTRVNMDMATNAIQRNCEFIFATSNDTYILCVVIIDVAGGLFEGESMLVVAAEGEAANSLRVNLRPRKNVPASMKIQVHVGAR